MTKKYDIIETTTVETLWGGEVTRKKIKDDYVFVGIYDTLNLTMMNECKIKTCTPS